MPASRKPIDEALAMAGIKRPSSKELTRDRSGATGDEHLVRLWLARYESENTRRGYQNDADRFAAFLAGRGAELRTLTVDNLIEYLNDLRDSGAPATIARRVGSVKSLLTFGHETGYLQFNVGAALKSPKLHDHLSERILTMEQVRALVGAAKQGRNRCLLRFLYLSGARVSEACGLEWRHVRSDPTSLRVTLHGKGKKTRHLALPLTLQADFKYLEQVRLGKYVFETQYGNPLDVKDAWRIVRAAAERAGIKLNVSPHWLRHAHATHALMRGAPVHVVQESLGHSSLATTGRYAHMNSSESSALFLSI